MAYCFYRNKNKYKTLKKKDQISSKIKESKEFKKVQFNTNIKVFIIPRVRSQDSLTRSLLWYNYEELNKFYYDKKRELIFEDLQLKTLKLSKKNKSETNIQASKINTYKRSRSNTI